MEVIDNILLSPLYLSGAVINLVLVRPVEAMLNYFSPTVENISVENTAIQTPYDDYYNSPWYKSPDQLEREYYSEQATKIADLCW